MQLDGILETSLYCADLAQATRFYRDILGLELIGAQPDRHAFFRCGESVLLLFDAAKTAREPTSVRGQAVPLHGATGPGHVAFRVCEAQLDVWRDQLRSLGVEIESEVAWPGGGRSFYFRDPAGNSVEIATPELWSVSEARP